jgi:hypothetical protein
MSDGIPPPHPHQALARHSDEPEPTADLPRAFVGSRCATAALSAMVAQERLTNAPIGLLIERRFPVDRYRRG